MFTPVVGFILLGFRNEGWFDPWILLNGFKKKATSLGADYISGEVVGINVKNDSVKSVKVKSNRGISSYHSTYLL